MNDVDDLFVSSDHTNRPKHMNNLTGLQLSRKICQRRRIVAASGCLILLSSASVKPRISPPPTSVVDLLVFLSGPSSSSDELSSASCDASALTTFPVERFSRVFR